jgi:hypothetical protein
VEFAAFIMALVPLEAVDEIVAAPEGVTDQTTLPVLLITVNV